MNEQPEPRKPAQDASRNQAQGAASELPVLHSLAMPAPENTFIRFRRRATLMQGTRMLFESQVTGFWIVLDAFLRLLLGGGPSGKQRAAEGDRA
jgi:hypothetical protein